MAALKLTYYGHSCFSVEAAGKHVLFDPFITPNPLAREVDVDAIRGPSRKTNNSILQP